MLSAANNYSTNQHVDGAKQEPELDNFELQQTLHYSRDFKVQNSRQEMDV